MVSRYSRNAQDEQPATFDFSFNYDSNIGEIGQPVPPFDTAHTPVTVGNENTDAIPAFTDFEWRSMIKDLRSKNATLSNSLEKEKMTTRELRSKLRLAQSRIEAFEILFISPAQTTRNSNSTAIESNAETFISATTLGSSPQTTKDGTRGTPIPIDEDDSNVNFGSMHSNCEDIAEMNKRRRTKKEELRFKCDKCPKRFTRSSTLREHDRTHSDHRPFKCSLCGKAFVRLKDRNRHDAVHNREKKFACKGGRGGLYGTWGCGRGFAREDALVAHFRNEAGWTCLRHLLIGLLQLFDRQDEGKTLQCRKAIRFVVSTFAINRDFEKSGCETVFLTKGDLELHFQIAAGRKCIGGLLVEVATSDARRYRKENKAVEKSMVALPDSHGDEDTSEVAIAELTRPNDPRERISRNEILGSTVPLETNSNTSSPIRFLSSSNFQVLGTLAGTAGEMIHVKVALPRDISWSYENFRRIWKLRFGDAIVEASKSWFRGTDDWQISSQVPEISTTGCRTARVPLSVETPRTDILLLGDFTYLTTTEAWA